MIEKEKYFMLCEKCNQTFEEKEIHTHHLIPKCIGGTDADGRINLCKKHHDIIHFFIPKLIFKYVPENLKNMCRKEIKDYTLAWIKREDKNDNTPLDS